MKKTLVAALITSVLFSLWVGKDLLKPEFFRSHDGLYHVIRLHQFDLSLRSGQFPVRWAPTLLNGLGYPLFIINYTLPYYLAELGYWLTGSFFTAIKITLLVSLVTGAVTSWWLFESWTKNSLAATVGSVFYTLAPYRLANIFERGALGEAVAYAFVPLLFLGADRLVKRRQILPLSLALAGVILSHTVVALIFWPFLLVYIFWTGGLQKPLLFPLIASLILALSLSAFQLLPSVFERQYMHFDRNLLNAYLGHFKNLSQLLRLPQSQVNLGTRFQVSAGHSLILVLSLVIILKSKRTRPSRQLFFALSSLLALFLITPASKLLWDNLKPLQFILYPWRFLGGVAFATSALAALIVTQFKRFKILLAILLVSLGVYVNRHYTKVDEFIPPRFPQQLLEGSGTTQNEFDPIWLQASALVNASPVVEAVSPQVKIINFVSRPNNFRARIEAQEEGWVKVGQVYFPGWQAFIDEQKVPILPTFNHDQHDLRGLIVIKVPPGDHQLKVNFKDTPVRQLGNWLSLFTGLGLIGSSLVKRKQPNLHYS